MVVQKSYNFYRESPIRILLEYSGEKRKAKLRMSSDANPDCGVARRADWEVWWRRERGMENLVCANGVGVLFSYRVNTATRSIFYRPYGILEESPYKFIPLSIVLQFLRIRMNILKQVKSFRRIPEYAVMNYTLKEKKRKKKWKKNKMNRINLYSESKSKNYFLKLYTMHFRSIMQWAFKCFKPNRK